MKIFSPNKNIDDLYFRKGKIGLNSYERIYFLNQHFYIALGKKGGLYSNLSSCAHAFPGPNGYENILKGLVRMRVISEKDYDEHMEMADFDAAWRVLAAYVEGVIRDV